MQASMWGYRKVGQLLRDAARLAARRLIKPGAPKLSEGDQCRVRYSLVAVTGGTLLRGSAVSITGVQDPQGRYQVRVVEVPDYQWVETNRLPYGPGFVLFVDGDALEKH